MMQQTWFTQTNHVPRWCTCHAHIRIVHWAPRGSPSQKYLPASRLFCFITHGCYLRTVCDVSCSQSRLHRKCLPASRVFLFHNTRLLSPDRVRCTIIKIFNSPASHSRVVKFSIPASFSQTPRAPPPHTHTHQNLLGRAHTHTHPPSLETLARSLPPQGLPC